MDTELVSENLSLSVLMEGEADLYPQPPDLGVNLVRYRGRCWLWLDSVTSVLHLPWRILSLVELELAVVELMGRLVSSDITSDIRELRPGESKLRPR